MGGVYSEQWLADLQCDLKLDVHMRFLCDADRDSTRGGVAHFRFRHLHRQSRTVFRGITRPLSMRHSLLPPGAPYRATRRVIIARPVLRVGHEMYVQDLPSPVGNI
jgi:hypothetical protein